MPGNVSKNTDNKIVFRDSTFSNNNKTGNHPSSINKNMYYDPNM